jgi:hypothetical protein
MFKFLWVAEKEFRELLQKNLVVRSRVAIDPLTEKHFGHCSKNLVTIFWLPTWVIEIFWLLIVAIKNGNHFFRLPRLAIEFLG